jgi:hypothetical protein
VAAAEMPAIATVASSATLVPEIIVGYPPYEWMRQVETLATSRRRFHGGRLRIS